MPNIQVLDESTIDKIAAGEVIERPASVVKELLENAIDARATAVTIEIKEGGISLIRVTDNGCGIVGEQVPLAFLRHATSKIRSVEDLITVASLGFRGEALSSIAAVSQVELVTKTSESLTGTRYQIEGGKEKSLEEIGAPDGTTFLVRNLFYNTPARKKFLKTPTTEGAHIGDLVEKIALSHPEVSIRFIQNNQNKLHTSGNHNLKDIIYTIYGREIAANLLAIEKTGGEQLILHGFIGKPVIARGNRNFENYYINGRYIKSSLISKAIEDAYKPFMMQHKYPFTLLHFTMEPEFLDVNVHPTKMELRFRDGEMVYRMITETISRALSMKELIPDVSLVKPKEEKKAAFPKESTPEPFERRRTENMFREVLDYSVYGKVDETPVQRPDGGQRELKPVRLDKSVGELKPHTASAPVYPEFTSKKSGDVFYEKMAGVLEHAADAEEPPSQQSACAQMDLFDEKLLSAPARSRQRLIGQLFDTYWLIEYREQLYIVDQHAAHEKVLYEKTIRSLNNREYTSQLLNPPIILTLNAHEELLLQKHMDDFAAIGFEIEHFGGKEYAVRGVPDNLFSIAKKELLLEMIDGLSDDLSTKNQDMIYERVASMSCKAAVKGNHQMTPAEADHLIDQLLDLENPYACPHGRPTVISMSKYELEKKFKRIV